jgi:CrcB protein
MSPKEEQFVQKLFLLFIAGGLGSLSRYTLAGLVQRLAGTSFPAGTFAVNCLGCFLFGLAWSLFEDRLSLPPEMRVIVLTGFMGAFTTFSTYIFETANLISASQWVYAVANCAGQLVVGLVFLWIGLSLGRLV